MGSFPIDIDLRFDQSSALKAYADFTNKAKAMMKDLEGGVAGASQKLTKLQDDFAKQMISTSTRYGRQLENNIRALERQAQMAGKTGEEKIAARFDDLTKKLGDNEKAMARVLAAKQKFIEIERSQGAKAREEEIKALEKRAQLYGKSGVDLMITKYHQEVEALKGTEAEIKRVTVAYQQMVDVEQKAARAATEREIGGIQKRGVFAGKTGVEKLEAERTQDIAKYGNDARIALAYDQQIEAVKKETAAATEREVKALVQRNELAGKSGVARLEVERAQALEKYNNDQRVALSYEKQIAAERQKEAQAIEKNIGALEKRAALAGKTGAAKLRAELAEEIKLYKGNEEAIKRVTTAYEKMIAAEKPKGGGMLGLLFRGGRDILEGRTTYGVMDIGRAAFNQVTGGAEGGGGLASLVGGAAGGAGATGLSGISTGVLAVGGLAAAIGAVEMVSYKSAKATAEFALHVRELQGVTGMTAREVQQLEVAARLSGKSVEDIAHGMRGFTQALEGGGTAAVKASKDLQKMGVDVVGLRLGTIGTYEALRQLGDAVKNNKDAFESNLQLMDIFKKSGLNIKQMVKELGEAEELSGKIHIFTPEQFAEMERTHRQLTEIETRAKNLYQLFQFYTAKPFVWTVDIVVKAGEHLMHGAEVTTGISGILREEVLRALGLLPTTRPPDLGAPRAFVGPTAKDLQAGRMGEFDKYLAGIGTAGLPGAEQKLSELKTRLTEMRRGTTENITAYVANPDKWRADERSLAQQVESQEAYIKSLQKSITNEEAIQEMLRRARLEAQQREQNQFMLPAEAELNKALRMPGIKPGERVAITRILAPQIAFQREQRTDKQQRQMLETQQTVTRELGRAQAGGVEAVSIRELGQGGVTRADVERDITAQYRERMGIAMKTYQDEIRDIQARKILEGDDDARAQQRRDIVATTGRLAFAQAEAVNAKKKEGHDLDEREREQERKHVETMSRIQLADQEESIKHDADLARKRAELRFKGDNPAAGIVEAYRIATVEAQQLYELEMRRIDATEFGDKAKEDRAIALHKLHREDETAQEEAQFKLAEMQQQQLQALKGALEPLYHTLFTKPSEFGKQLRQTVQEAALKPIVGGLSEATASVLHPLIYGAGGTGGIAGGLHGMFGGGGRLNDIKLTSTGAVPVHIESMSGGFGGGGMMAAGTSIFNVGGFGGGSRTFGGGGFGPGGTPGFFPGAIFGGGDINAGGGGFNLGGGTTVGQLQGLPTRTTGYDVGGLATSTLGAVLGGGGGGGSGSIIGRVLGLGGGRGVWDEREAGGGFGLGGLRGIFSREGLGGLTRSTGVDPGGNGPAGGGGKITGMSGMLGAATFAGGMTAAQWGLLGGGRGTWGGIAGGALGGAAMGFAIGGPLGAAIGAGIGLGIGVGEKIAGVETPQREAKRLVKELYRIDINNSTADQIVGIAKQSYAGRVSLAVRAPEVRHMLGLYAAGTGQSSLFAQSANEAHGASLVESGGRLQQQATYQYGQAFAQSSNLPVYGGVPTQTLGAPGGGMQLSLNIGGQDAAKFLSGNVVSPDVVSTQYAAAMSGSNGRVPQALMLSEPGAIAS